MQGLLHADLRVLSIIELEVDGLPVVPLRHRLGANATRFTGLVAHTDSLLRCDRQRTLTPGTMREDITLSSAAPETLTPEVEVLLGSDFAPIDIWRAGQCGQPSPFDAEIAPGTASWTKAGLTVTLTAEGATIAEGEDGLLLAWAPAVAAGATVSLSWSVTIRDPGGAVMASGTPGMDVDAVLAQVTDDMVPDRARVLVPWVRQSLNDLNALRMSLPALPHESFFAAGAPWFLTLFGRDSVWTARMLLPVNLADAVSTLTVLAHLQGTKDDPDAAEAPGKIMHELRREALDIGEAVLPPLYFGTIDATALWVCLFHDCWEAGMDEAAARELLPSLRAACAWITGPADADGDGFAEYLDTSGHGLVNQGWKDSGDSIRFHDGSQAEAPVALVEVQGYAHEAALGAASILTDLGEPGAPELIAWAKALAKRFRERFWCDVDGDRFPALALDGHKRRVDSVTSNIGHLLGTGLLTKDEERRVVARLLRPDMQEGYGLRTLAASEPAYNPLSYHCGTIWAHDTAIVMANMMRAGYEKEARLLADGLVRSAALFEYRMPELYSGEGEGIPYPAACRPQAWSAAAAVVTALMG